MTSSELQSRLKRARETNQLLDQFHSEQEGRINPGLCSPCCGLTYIHTLLLDAAFGDDWDRLCQALAFTEDTLLHWEQHGLYSYGDAKEQVEPDKQSDDRRSAAELRHAHDFIYRFHRWGIAHDMPEIEDRDLYVVEAVLCWVLKHESSFGEQLLKFKVMMAPPFAPPADFTT